jgi:chemotaxis protein MotB
MSFEPYSPVRRFLSFPWAITFSDLCIVLLCFFILLTSTTRTDPERYSEISESLQDHFGANKQAPTLALVNPTAADLTPDAMSVLPAPTEALNIKPGHADPLPLYHDVNKVRELLKNFRERKVVEVSAFKDHIRVQFAPVPSGDELVRLSYYQDVTEAVRLLQNSRDEWAHEVSVYGATDALLDAAGARIRNIQHAGDDASKLQLTQMTKNLEQAFIRERQSGMISVEQLSHSVRVRLGEVGAFAPGEAALTSTATLVVDRIGEAAKASGARILIGGHTDTMPINTARFRDNWELSAARAISVVRELVNRRGIDPARIEAQGYGDTQPLLSNDSPEHRAMNRRIEITLELPNN